MTAPLELSIPSFTTSTADSKTSCTGTTKPYTVYNITLRQPLRSYIISKRFSEFLALHTSITSQCDNMSPPLSPPPKTYFQNSVTNTSLAESRRVQLGQYLKAINEASDSRWRTCSAWRSFLNLPSSTTSGSSSKTAQSKTSGSTTAATTTMDQGVWLDVHRDIKSHLREARQHIHSRDQAEIPQRQHEESADAKRSIVRASTMLNALEKALKEYEVQIGRSAKEQREAGTTVLGSGEIRRRRDMFTAAVSERDGLESSLAAGAVGRQGAGGTQAGESPDERNAKSELLKSVHATGGNSRRVIGAPAKETERTKELDNQGVLQLQKQIMKEQDLDVDEITKTVQRMKQMGVQINEELVLQNEMLGLLDQDVERVGDKINVAKKRIGKIK